MRELNVVRRAALAGALALSLTGVTAALDGAEAMPAAALAPITTSGGVATVQYDGYGYRRPYRPYRRYAYRYRGRAGVYDCGPGALRTHLERKACR